MKTGAICERPCIDQAGRTFNHKPICRECIERITPSEPQNEEMDKQTETVPGDREG